MALKKDGQNPLWGGFPRLGIDFDGGVRVPGGYYEKGVGGARLSREVVGSDWKLSEGDDPVFNTEIEADGEVVKILTWRPFLLQEYTRSYGHLLRVHLSVVDLVNVAGISRILAPGDLTRMADLRESCRDTAVSITFVLGEPRLIISRRVGREVNSNQVREEDFSPLKTGFVAGAPEYVYESDFDFLRGKVGIEILANRVVFYYVGELGIHDRQTRTNVIEIKRMVSGIPLLDREVPQGMPSDEVLLHFLEEVLPEVNK